MVVHLLSGEGAARQASRIHACRSSASMSVGDEARIIRRQRVRVKAADACPYTFGRYRKLAGSTEVWHDRPRLWSAEVFRTLGLGRGNNAGTIAPKHQAKR